MIEPLTLQTKWDKRYREQETLSAPALVLSENAHLLPANGRALDLACGLGANALFLAQRGLTVEAWDLSPVAIMRLAERSDSLGLPVQARVRDVVADPPRPQTLDIIMVGHFLERSLAPVLAAALRPGGLLFYQTFSRDAVSDQGPANPAYRLATNELLVLFDGLVVRVYREEGRLGDLAHGWRDRALLVTERPR